MKVIITIMDEYSTICGIIPVAGSRGPYCVKRQKTIERVHEHSQVDEVTLHYLQYLRELIKQDISQINVNVIDFNSFVRQCARDPIGTSAPCAPV